MGDQLRPGLRPKRARIVARSTDPPAGATVLCVDELGPVTPRTFPPGPGWSPDGHRIKHPLDYGRGYDKTWIYGALSPRDGHTLTLSARSRTTVGFQTLLDHIDNAYPQGDLYIISDNLSNHTSAPIQTWLADHPRVQHVQLPTHACWLNLIEGWWRLFRRDAFAGQSFADHTEIEAAATRATHQLNHRARPWIWGRPAPAHRHLRRRFVYRI